MPESIVEKFRRLKNQFLAPVSRPIWLIPDSGAIRKRMLEDEKRRRDFLIPGVINGTVSFSGRNGYGQEVTETIDFDHRDEHGLPTRTLIVDSPVLESK